MAKRPNERRVAKADLEQVQSNFDDEREAQEMPRWTPELIDKISVPMRQVDRISHFTNFHGQIWRAVTKFIPLLQSPLAQYGYR
jgi:hypothetical protein